jgi:hypothetical protein
MTVMQKHKHTHTHTLLSSLDSSSSSHLAPLVPTSRSPLNGVSVITHSTLIHHLDVTVPWSTSPHLSLLIIPTSLFSSPSPPRLLLLLVPPPSTTIRPLTSSPPPGLPVAAKSSSVAWLSSLHIFPHPNGSINHPPLPFSSTPSQRMTVNRWSS